MKFINKLKNYIPIIILILTYSVEARSDINVVTSIKPLHSIASNIMDGISEPLLLVEGTTSPHSYVLKPSHVEAINNADLIFYVSDDLETFLERPLSNIGTETSVVELIKNKDLFGINITLPYKQKIVPHLDILVNDAEVTSSVNTVYLDEQSRVIGENTDVFGLQAAYLKEVDNSSKKKTLVIGAGGVSPSVILALQKSGVKDISIINRTKEKCIFLKKKFKKTQEYTS